MIKTSFENSICDIFLLYTSGIPIFAGCTGSEYCMNHYESHELHAGFFSAIYNFSRETGIGSNLQSIIFDDIQLNFKIDELEKVMLVFVHMKTAKLRIIQKQLDYALGIFLKKYKPILRKHYIERELFVEFMNDLKEKGIVNYKRIFPSKKMLLNQNDVISRGFGFLKNSPSI